MAPNSSKDWSARIDPELRPVYRRLPTSITYTPFKVKLLRLALRMPVPIKVPRGVVCEDVPVGRYFRPASTATASAPEGNAKKGSDDGLGRRAAPGEAAAILWMHGGGRMFGTARMDGTTCIRLVERLGVPVLSVEYRMAPDHPFPAALDDCIAAWEWLVDRVAAARGSAVEGTDAATPRIAVAGESAGGGLAAELCQRLCDEAKRCSDDDNEQKDDHGDTGARRPERLVPAAQVLVYPMLDDRTVLDSAKTELRHPVWNNDSNRLGWSSYLGPEHAPGDDELPPYAAAARRTDLSGLPPTWVMVGELDLFLDEGRTYASRLEEAGVESHFLEVKGGFHGLLQMGRNEGPVVRIWDGMSDFLRRHLVQGNA